MIFTVIGNYLRLQGGVDQRMMEIIGARYNTPHMVQLYVVLRKLDFF